MIKPLLAGTETEYGFTVEGRGAADQIDDAKALVRSFPGECFVGWDYRYESPRADIRGFKLENLAFDPEDAKFDLGRQHGRDADVRADRVLINGARFYNDHGHPEYSTPECWSLSELVRQDRIGEAVVLSAARAYSENIGRSVKVFKNNTDFHGASYGSHESYLVSRSMPWEEVYAAILPLLICRQILTGAGKVGSEVGPPCEYQISQRSDFFVEPINTETLYRRPIFNTRDEPHADPRHFLRLHVISGDANMIESCTARKVGLVKLGLYLAEAGAAPSWSIKDPVRAFQGISRDQSHCFEVSLESGSWSTAAEILESYFAAAEHLLELDSDMAWLINDCRRLMAVGPDSAEFARHVDWAAKQHMLRSFLEAEGGKWDNAHLQAFDLEYHNVDRGEGLYYALADMGTAEEPSVGVDAALSLTERGRAYVRGLAVGKFGSSLQTLSWSSLSFDVNGNVVEVELAPDKIYSGQLGNASGVENFIHELQSDSVER